MTTTIKERDNKTTITHLFHVDTVHFHNGRVSRCNDFTLRVARNHVEAEASVANINLLGCSFLELSKVILQCVHG